MSALAYRRDIDGLRALAVLLVVGFHAFPQWVRGGFVGVDIFFVISGYLITGLLLKELAAGPLHIGLFYQRRVRRLFPALLAVLCSVCLAGWYWLAPDAFKMLGQHILGAVSFTSNLLLLSESGYFDQAAETKLLLHLWSLAVEEQFYLLFPWLLVLTVARRQVLRWLLIVTAASLLANLVFISLSPSATFYVPITRFWELLAGSCLASWQAQRSKPLWQGWVADLMVLAGAAAVLASVWLLDRHAAFPGVWALLPVLGACLFLAAGREAWLGRHVLSARPVVWFGLISYPLYLWHWPLLALATQFDPKPLRSVRVGLVLLAIVLAAITYYAIERPLRERADGRRVVIGSLGIFTLLGALGAAMATGVLPARGLDQAGNAYIASRDQSRQLREQLRPQPCPANLPVSARVRPLCSIYGDAKSPRQMVAWGDSHIDSWSPVLDALARQHQVRLVVFQAPGCAPLLAVRRSDPLSQRGPCGRLGLAEEVLAAMKLLAPERIIWIARWGVYGNGWIRGGQLEPETLFLTQDSQASATRETSRAAMASSFLPTARALTAVAPVVLIKTVPELKAPVSFFNLAHLDRIEPGIDEEQHRLGAVPILYEQVARLHGMTSYDPAVRLCAPRCHAILDKRVMYDDENHLSAHGALYFAPDLERYFQ